MWTKRSAFLFPHSCPIPALFLLVCCFPLFLSNPCSFTAVLSLFPIYWPIPELFHHSCRIPALFLLVCCFPLFLSNPCSFVAVALQFGLISSFIPFTGQYLSFSIIPVQSLIFFWPLGYISVSGKVGSGILSSSRISTGHTDFRARTAFCMRNPLYHVLIALEVGLLAQPSCQVSLPMA